ncbi:hypothetical protein [Streptomyces sp. NPDC056069]|uniref:hypothetical protein n=1 Tax=Streptomyces sp. NPDC056069 TaxID=3345702 RepID=UPI0035D63C71
MHIPNAAAGLVLVDGGSPYRHQLSIREPDSRTPDDGHGRGGAVISALAGPAGTAVETDTGLDGLIDCWVGLGAA